MGIIGTAWLLAITLIIYRVVADSPIDGVAARISSLDNVNMFAPEFNQTELRGSVPEDSPVGQVVVKITAFDRDSGNEGVITYSLHHNEGMFRIDPISGVVTVASYFIDREMKDIYVLLVQAEDGGGLFSTKTLIITIEDVNDNPPIFEQITCNVILPENEVYFTRPLQLKATDYDKPGTENSNITYSLSSSSTPPGLAGHFHINPLTGNITVAQALDFDSISFIAGHPGEITLTALAKDQGLVPLSSTVVITITLVDVLELRTTVYVTDVNDNPPKFERSLYTADVYEDTPVGTTVFTDIHTRDPDTGAGGVVTYSMTPVDSDARDIFVINSVSGSVTLNQRLYSRTTKSYYYIVTATDGDGLSSVADLIFVVRGGTDTLSLGSSSTPTKESTMFRHTSTYKSTTRIHYLSKSTTTVPFTTKPSTVRSSEYTISSLPESSRSSSTWATPPPFSWSTHCDAILRENEVSFNRPLRLEATDEIEPGSESSNILYSLSSSSAPSGLAGHFHIDPFTGDISVVQPLDYDNISFSAGNPGAINLTAMIRDHGRSLLNSTIPFTIILLDINDNTPQFEKSEYLTAVPENVGIGYQLMVVGAHDADGTAPNNHVFYFLETGGRDQFAIDHVTGAITVVGELDRERVASYSLQVMARDQAADPRHSYCTVYIDVSDINDEPPRFREKHVTIDVSDGVFGGIYNMSAVDFDINSHLKYSILWEDSYGLTGLNEFLHGEELMQWVDVDADSGVIHEKRPLDRTQVRQINLLLLVQDLNATDPTLQEDSAYLIINVRAINRNRRSAERSDVPDTSPISNQGRKETHAEVTFSVGLSHYVELTETERIVYNKIFVNVGNGYCSRTGTFTCPQSGKYVFGIHVFAPSNSSVWLSLYHNVTNVLTFEMHAEEDSKADSGTAVLKLTQGDKVYVMSTPGHSSRLFSAPDAILSTFSGYLLSPIFE